MAIVENSSYLIVRCGPSPPFVILELLEVPDEPRIDPGRQLPPY